MATCNPNINYLRLCLDSIQKQTFKDFELILVDDGTTNCKLEDILSTYSFDYQIIKNEINLGLPTSLNKGLQYCNSEYIARMDDDDIMAENRLERELQYAKKHDGIIFSRVKKIDLDGREIFFEDHDVNIKLYLKKSGNCLTHSTLFAKKALLIDVGGYNTKFTYAQDYELYMRLIDKVNFYRMNEQLLFYRINTNTNITKRVMSLLYCYGAAILYFSKGKKLVYNYYFFRRSFSLIRTLYFMVWKS